MKKTTAILLMIITSLVTGYVCNHNGIEDGKMIGISIGMKVEAEDHSRTEALAYERGHIAGIQESLR
jgi:hypothetical protein